MLKLIPNILLVSYTKFALVNFFKNSLQEIIKECQIKMKFTIRKT